MSIAPSETCVGALILNGEIIGEITHMEIKFVRKDAPLKFD